MILTHWFFFRFKSGGIALEGGGGLNRGRVIKLRRQRAFRLG